MPRAIPGSRSSRRAPAVVALLALTAAGGAAARPNAAPPPQASPAATRRCLIGLGVSVTPVPARAAVGPEGDLAFVFPSAHHGRLSFFATAAAARRRVAADDAKAADAKTPAPYRVLNVEVRWAAKPALPSTTEKALLGRCIVERGAPTAG